MERSEIPDQSYTSTWSDGRGEVKYFYRVIPLLWDSFTFYALERPGE